METGRSTRRRLSASSIIETTAAKDEALGLLSEVREGEDEERSIDVKVRNQGIGADYSKWLQPLSIAFVVLLVLTIAFTSTSKLYRSFKYFADLDLVRQNGSHDEMLGIRLHPRDHVFRPPTTISHHWNITTGFRSPDGVKKQVYLVNDLFPGPTIECRPGDRLIVHVTNNLDSGEGVSIHWHGLEMRNATNMDGAVGFTQCPIPVTRTFTYEFEVSEAQVGTFWWHAHSQVERGDGMYGGLVIHKPIVVEDEMKGYGYEDEVLLMVSDWYHRSAEEVLAWYTSVRGFGNEVGFSLPLHHSRRRA
jgi:FtsP/CotA-like multicopper oxidase with cupredoxin domain